VYRHGWASFRYLLEPSSEAIALKRIEDQGSDAAILFELALGGLQVDDLSQTLLAVQARYQGGYAICLTRG
jgi:hypothetical protein